MNPIKLTEYSHGAGCGCKISPRILDTILQSKLQLPGQADPHLLVGDDSRDDAAVYDIGNGQAIVSTTDFFMPIVDDPFDFGRIAATNAISDIYAMGGRPLMAIAILGWPLEKLPPEVAQQVVDGGRSVCQEAGISLAGGHSIDAPEPIFGLAVTGSVEIAKLKQNSTAIAGCQLYLTKPLGIGILTTAQKHKKLLPEHENIARDSMCRLNSIGSEIAAIEEVKALTDVTGFGLLGHLSEICEGSQVNAVIDFAKVPKLPAVEYYRNLGCVPGGTQRNYDSYGEKIGTISEAQKQLLCDPQTSGGLLIAVQEEGQAKLLERLKYHNMSTQPIGRLVPRSDQSQPYISIAS